MNVRIYIYILLALLISFQAQATHNRAGEITYEHIAGNTYRAKIVTYTKIAAPAPDRPELEIFWGDGENDTIARVSEVQVKPDIKRNEYLGVHTYSGPGSYILYFIDENRNSGIINMTQSVTLPFYVETKLVINPLLNQLNLANNSPVMLEPPIDDGVVNQLFIHNPSAYDPDGDSLSYEITVCKGFNGVAVPGYFLPGPPAYPGSNISMDGMSGDFLWNVPTQIGQYNYAILIKEWKRIPGLGVINVGYVTRDFQVDITAINNLPPLINVNDTCVEAGSTLAFDVTGTDPDNDIVTVTASGAPFQLNSSPAIHDTTNVSGSGSAIYNFIWPTNCLHVRKNPYQVVFKATDNNLFVQLSAISSMNITVVAPAPKNPVADPSGDSISLHWNPSVCSNAAGYNIYRKVNLANYTPPNCVTGVPASTGYVLIGKTTGVNDTVFHDSNNGQGLATAIEFCYMITAYFADGAESYPSVEVCARLQRDLPVITNVDVLTTSTSTGTIYVAWSPPVDLDTINYPGPFQYVLQRAESTTGIFADIVTFNNWNDTLYTDFSLNTENNQYIYRVQFNYNGNVMLGASQPATSIYLTALPGDNKVRLSWNLNVPWTNSLYYIYRSDTGGPFSLIDSTTATSYTDYTALNTLEYCYYVESIGGYAQGVLISPLINKSQIDCTVPFDNEAPCIPVLTAEGNCDSANVNFTWIYTVVNDCKVNDIDYFTVYFSAEQNGEYDSVGYFTSGLNAYSFERTATLGGCYYLTVTDTNGNVSDSSNSVCIESCPIYELPNIFTPDGNGINDFFTPVAQTTEGLFFRDIKEIDLKIYNRWGDILFETKDPLIRWNGKRNNDGEDVPDGTYYYTCLVYTTSTEATEPMKLHGPVHIFRGTNTE